MMYHNRFVAVIKVDGKVLREQNGEVTLPFGSEYSLLLKNLNSRKAMVKVSLDGQDATDGWLVIDPNSDLDLERFIRNGNLNKGNRFKFIERTSEIENHRGIKAEDGLVRVEYKFERAVEEIPIYSHRYYDWVYYSPKYYPYYPWNHWTFSNGDALTSTSGIKGSSAFIGSLQSSNNVQYSVNECKVSEDFANDQGITVAGSESNQSFNSVQWFDTEHSEVLIIKLRGEHSGHKVSQPIVVQNKPKCITCGRINKATSKFCNQCGTSLILI